MKYTKWLSQVTKIQIINKIDGDSNLYLIVNTFPFFVTV